MSVKPALAACLRIALGLAAALPACDDAVPQPSSAADASGDATPAIDGSPADATTADAGVARDDAGFELRPLAGRWFAGDLHVHSTGASNDTGGDSFPEEISMVARERGLDFVVLTDHSNSTGSDPSTRDEDPLLFNLGPEFPYRERVAALSDDTFLMVQGNELSPVSENEDAPRGHVLCVPGPEAEFNPEAIFIDRPRGVISGGNALAQAHAAGCFTVVAHPYSPASHINFDWTVDFANERSYHALEVFNGGAGFDLFDQRGLDAWTCDLAQGRAVVGVGGSDNHRVHEPWPGGVLDPALGAPTTWIFAPSLTWADLGTALAAGRVSVGNTPSPLEVDVYDADRAWLGLGGDTVAAERVALLRMRGTQPADAPTRQLIVLRVRPGDCADDPRAPGVIDPPVPTPETAHTEALGPGPFDRTVPITLAPGEHLLVRVAPERVGAREQAIGLANPIRGR